MEFSHQVPLLNPWVPNSSHQQPDSLRFDFQPLWCSFTCQKFGTCYKNMSMDAMVWFSMHHCFWLFLSFRQCVDSINSLDTPIFCCLTKQGPVVEKLWSPTKIGDWSKNLHIFVRIPKTTKQLQKKNLTTLATFELFIHLIFHLHWLNSSPWLGPRVV